MNVGPEFTNIISGVVLVVAAGLEVLQMYLRQRAEAHTDFRTRCCCLTSASYWKDE